MTILPDYVSYFRQLHYGFTLPGCNSWAHFFLQRRMTFFEFLVTGWESKAICKVVCQELLQYLFTAIKILTRKFCFCALIFLVVAHEAWQPDSLIPTPALAETGNQGRVCNQPSLCRAPWGQYTLVLDPSASTTTTALSKYRWEPRAGGDRVSRHPSSTGLRFSPVATNHSSSSSSSLG